AGRSFLRRSLVVLSVIAVLLFLTASLWPLASPSATHATSASSRLAAGDDLAGLTPLERAHAILNDRTVEGRTPMQWLDVAHGFRVDKPAVVPLATGRIDD